MPTERLFDEDAYLTEFTAVVQGWTLDGGSFLVELDRTAFFPEGGGQFCDLGTLNGIPVTDVQEDSDGIIWHRISAPTETGLAVTGKIDWARRFDFMQQHSGEHIFSGIAHSLFGATNVGFHLGLDSTTIDLDIPLTEKCVEKIESLASSAIYKNVPFEISYPSAEELKSLSYRSKKELSGRVRIVAIPGYDVCACCGTHVTKAGEIGLIKVTSFQNYKGGTRLNLLCGKRAFADYQSKNSGVLAVTTGLSVKPEELQAAVLRLENEITERRIYEAGLRNELFSLKAEKLGGGEKICVFEKELSPDELRRFCLILAESFGIAAVFSGEKGEYKYTVASKTGDCREAAKKINSAFSGRGGGKAELCQGSCSGNEAEIRELCDNL